MWLKSIPSYPGNGLTQIPPAFYDQDISQANVYKTVRYETGGRRVKRQGVAQCVQVKRIISDLDLRRFPQSAWHF